MDSNHRPRAYQARALATWATDRSTQRLIRFVPLCRVDGIRTYFSNFVREIGFDWPSSTAIFALQCEHCESKIGGDDGIRTHDPLLAGQVLSQLSYTPEKSEEWRVKSEEVSLRSLILPFWVCSLRLRLKPDNWTTDSIRTLRIHITVKVFA